MTTANKINFKSFIGVDLHKMSVTLASVDNAGDKISVATFDTKCVNKIAKWLDEQPKPTHLAVEAVGFVEWFIDKFRNSVDKIDIADATELANLRGKRRKNDRNDALDIAKRLARNECPLGWIADEQTMQLRKLARHWRQLSNSIANAKRYLRSILLAANIRGPKTITSISAQRWFLAHNKLLKDVQRRCFANFIDNIALLERQRATLKRQIIQANKELRFENITELLKTVPGINDIWACIIAAEIGDFKRFPNADTLEFWAGMTPDNKQSSDRTQAGHITKAGSATLRWAICKAACVMCRSDGFQKTVRERIARRTGVKAKANVAMGRRLLRIIFAMVRDGTVYHNSQPTNHQAAANKARIKKINKNKKRKRQAVQ